MPAVERRYARSPIEFRAATKAGSVGTLYGYALKYDTLSQNLGGYVETVAPGAVDKSLADNLDVLCRYNHEDDGLLGRVASATLSLASDEVGLLYSVDLPDTTVGRDLAVLAERGDVYQSSFAFMTIEDEWDMTEQGFPLRTLKQIRLVDVAPVNSPAYLDTSSGLRSLAEARGLSFDEVSAAAAHNALGTLLTPAPVVDEERAADDEQEAPQVDNHGAAIARQRLMQLRLRRAN
jgi:HK97 family phage prohead protease